MNSPFFTFASQFQNTKTGLTTRFGKRTITLFVLILGIVAATGNVLAQNPARQKKVIPETVAQSLAERFMQAYVNADLQMLHKVLLLQADPRCGTPKESDVREKCLPPLIQHSLGTGMLSIRLRLPHEDTNGQALQWRSLWGRDECINLIDEASSPWANIISIKLKRSTYGNESNVWVADCTIKLLRDFGVNEKGRKKLNGEKSYYEKEEQHRLRVAFSFLPHSQGWKIKAVRPPYDLQVLFQSDNLAKVQHWLETSYTDDPYFLQALSSTWIHNIQIPARVWSKAHDEAIKKFRLFQNEERKKVKDKVKEEAIKREEEVRKQEEEFRSLLENALSGKLSKQEIKIFLQKMFSENLSKEEAKSVLMKTLSENLSEEEVNKIAEKIISYDPKAELTYLLERIFAENLSEEERKSFGRLSREEKQSLLIKIVNERLSDEERKKFEEKFENVLLKIEKQEATLSNPFEDVKTAGKIAAEKAEIFRAEIISKAENEQVAALSAVAEFCLKNAKTEEQRETILLNLAAALSPEKIQIFPPAKTVPPGQTLGDLNNMIYEPRQIAFTVTTDISARLIAESSSILARKEREVQQERDLKKKQERVKDEVVWRTALGLFYWQAGQLPQAVHCFEQNLGRHEETDADSLLRLTHILLQLGKYNQILQVVEQVKIPLSGKNAVQTKTVKLMAQTGILLNRGELTKVRKILAEGASEVKELCKGISDYECNNSKKLLMRYRIKLAFLQGNQLEAFAVLAETFDWNLDSDQAIANIFAHIFNLLLPGMEEDMRQAMVEGAAFSIFEGGNSYIYKSCGEDLIGNSFSFREWPTEITSWNSKTASKTVKNLPLISGVDIAERLTLQIISREDNLGVIGPFKNIRKDMVDFNYDSFELETMQLQSRNSALTGALNKLLEVEDYFQKYRKGLIYIYRNNHKTLTEKIYQYLDAAEELQSLDHKLLAATIKFQAMKQQVIMLEGIASEPELLRQTEETLKEVCDFYRMSGMREELITSLHLRARTLRQLQLLDEASACLDEAIENVELLRSHQLPLALLELYMPEIAGKYAEVYHTALGVNADLATQLSLEKKEPQRVYALREKTLKLADSIKSRFLYDSLSTQTANRKNETDKDNAGREKSAWLYSSIPELEHGIQSMVEERSYSPLTESLEPALLVPDQRTKVLSFTITDDGIHMFVLSRSIDGKISINPYFQAFDAAPISSPDISPGKSELEKTVRKFRQSLEDTQELGYKALANKLSKMLWGDALPAELKKDDHLIIVPDGVLWDVPFAALMAGDLHLIEKFTLSFAPSLSTLQGLKKQPRTCQLNEASQNLILIAPNQIDPQRANRTSSSVPVKDMVESLKNIYPGSALKPVLLQKSTQKADIKSLLTSCNSIIQIINHAETDYDDPMSSYISLSNVQLKANSLSNRASATEKSARLTLGEILQLPTPIQADTVILSACKTGVGSFRLGEAPLSLAWGFLQAGAQRCISTSWNVNAEVTMNLSTKYHTIKKQTTGLTVNASALRDAQLEIKKQYPHPYYWAGFALWGIE